MVFLHRFICITVLVALLAGVTTATFAQEADADQAKALLKQGVSQFEARNYQQAKVVLLKAAELKALTGDEKKTLDDYLVRVDPAIRKQRAALEAYRAGEKALKAGELSEAKTQFTAAASSPFLRQAEIKDAKAELAVVDFKINAAAAAAKDEADDAEDVAEDDDEAETDEADDEDFDGDDADEEGDDEEEAA